MKPLQLKMTAFGPYKFSETIDFTELKDNRLFVISGATGAGKTTIFDGICFALYGAGSGEDRRDTKIMRSDFATDDTHTAVELIFEIHNQKYRILRQLSHVKKGNKSATGERYEFFELQEAGEVPVVERQIVSEINKKVEEIIGLTLDQFSQIVMLPQGEFRKLLTSPTENKEAILRKIFKTEPYKMISEKLKDKKLIAEAELKKEELTRNGYTEQILASFPVRESSVFELIESSSFNTYQLVDALKEETNFYTEKIQLDEFTYNEAYTQHATKQVAYYEAKATNERFQELETKEQQLESLKEQTEVYAHKQSQLEAAERASTIETIETYYSDLQKEVQNKETLLELAQEEMTRAEEILEKVNILYNEEVSKKGVREKSVEAVIQLNGLVPLFEELETKKREMLLLEKSTASVKSQLDEKSMLFHKEKEAATEQKSVIDKLEDLVEPLDTKVQQLSLLQEQHTVIQEYLAIEKELQALMEKEIEQQNLFRDMKEAYDAEERKWMNNQASILASKLLPGEPCPVCGSKEHNTTSVDSHEESMNEEALRLLKEGLTQQETKWLTIRANKEAVKNQLQNLQERIEQLQVNMGQAEQVTGKLKQLQTDVSALRIEKNKLSLLKQPYKDLLAKVGNLEQEKNQLEMNYQQQKGLLEQAKAVYESKKIAIPAHVSSLQELQVQLLEAKRQKEALEHAWEETQNRLKSAQGACTKAVLTLEHADAAEKETKEKLDKAFENFQEALGKASFESVEAYKAAQLAEKERMVLKEQCMAYKQTVHTLTEQVTEGRQQLATKVKVELAPLEVELVQLKETYEQALNALNSTKEYEKAGRILEGKIVATSERIAGLEQQVHRIVDLYDMLRGQNHFKISFERYVQIEYLEQIVAAANERLKHMSNGQFQLLRSERQETHGKQSGLGLDVYDAYTGQTRDVKTLSGGEKFNTSLCLALGMADVIQSFQGSIRIDTMFIDEGFGSLDEESLNKAIDTLVDLQKSGRMIGVISHVAELKASIPAILEVEKAKEGYSKTKFVIK
ncbi:AAA family ATPase [Psychrobacillus lasiicapitis]|uniref:Nuclease SbcCD subunit C n=1 Tax=Psychrobacillus lasiicapitis TaxID=1636719 RepID=A0A544T6F9_9BACI|nr:SMC family ATPase [Psychrobacillus lasiicapitis]TQR13030.1 SMC family ATPase [Psychrobacillus lasiicapitis]GGA35049.1 nuclease SbcCD subunit C [Psychrobacillus lasiicapitis]